VCDDVAEIYIKKLFIVSTALRLRTFISFFAELFSFDCFTLKRNTFSQFVLNFLKQILSLVLSV
jgi:hypothetical protein